MLDQSEMTDCPVIDEVIEQLVAGEATFAGEVDRQNLVAHQLLRHTHRILHPLYDQVTKQKVGMGSEVVVVHLKHPTGVWALERAKDL